MTAPRITRKGTRRYLQAVVDRTGMSIAQVARRSGVAASTLYRIVDDDEPHIASQRTIAAIEGGTGISYAGVLSGQEPSQAEATRLEAGAAPDGIAPRNGAEAVWRLGSRAVELAGYLPGDLIVFELGATPAAGDVVIAEIEDRHGEVESVIRVYDPPYLVTRAIDPAAHERPVPVDGTAVRIVGRAARMLRDCRPAVEAAATG